MGEKGNPNFYLTTAGEYKLLSKPRACWFVRRLRDINRDDYMLVGKRGQWVNGVSVQLSDRM